MRREIWSQTKKCSFKSEKNFPNGGPTGKKGKKFVKGAIKVWPEIRGGWIIIRRMVNLKPASTAKKTKGRGREEQNSASQDVPCKSQISWG